MRFQPQDWFYSAKSRIPADARLRLRTALFRRPRLARIVGRINPATRPWYATRETTIVIDGFPRSANSLTHLALRDANPGLRLSSHMHSPVAFHDAKRMGIPRIMLIRHPHQAIASYLNFDHKASAGRAIAMYIAYYRATLPLLDSLVVADFSEVTSDLASVVQRCNDVFGTLLQAPDGPRDYRSIENPPTPSDRKSRVLDELSQQDQDALAAAVELYHRVLREARGSQLPESGATTG